MLSKVEAEEATNAKKLRCTSPVGDVWLGALLMSRIGLCQGHSDGDVRNGGVSHWDHSGPFGPKWDFLENAILGSESCALGVRCRNIASVGLWSRGKLPAMWTR